VYVSDRFIPLFGDAVKYLDDEKAERVRYYHIIQYGVQLKGYDLRLSVLGSAKELIN
jgi:hypothetical protein